MDARAVFLFSYTGMTTGVLGGDPLLNGLTDDQLRARPIEQVNSVIWALWHITRCEDITVNRMVTDSSEVFDEDDWLQRLNVSGRDIGTRMTSQEVTYFSAAIDLATFRAYRSAVIEQTRTVVESLSLTIWDERVPSTRVLRVAVEDEMLAYRPSDTWTAERSKGSWLFSHVINHGYRHLGEAYTIRSLLGVPQIA